MKPFMLTALITLVSLFIAAPADAHTVIKNESNETIRTHVMLTFVGKDGFVYQRQPVILKPGEQHVFDTGSMNNTRVVYLFIESVTYKKMYFGNPYFHEHEGYYHKTVRAPIWKNSFDGKGNKFIATRVAQGDFTAMKEYMPGSKDYPALRIQPKYGNSNGYEYIYRGINGQSSSRIWK